MNNLKPESYQTTQISGANSIADVLEQGNGKWGTAITGLRTECSNPDFDGLSMPEHRAVVRDDNGYGLGVVKGRWHEISNPKAFSFFDSIIQENKAEYSEYSEVDGGRKVIVTAKTPRIADVRLNDPIQSEIRMINSFDGSSSFQVIFSILRLVCTNGMTRKSRENSVSIRHTKNNEFAMQNAHNILMGEKANWEALLTNCRKLAQTSLDYSMVTRFIEDLTAIREEKPSQLNGKPTNQFNPVENYFTTLLGLNFSNLSGHKYNSACEIAELAHHGLGNDGSSVWDLFNGTTEYVDHHKGSNVDKRAKSSIIGAGATLKEKALELALAF